MTPVSKTGRRATPTKKQTFERSPSNKKTPVPPLDLTKLTQKPQVRKTFQSQAAKIQTLK